MWKWNLAFQCIVNIGVRGSENVRTRVVEADMVPVIATILWDYILVTNAEKAKAEADEAVQASKHTSTSRQSKLSRDLMSDSNTSSSFLEHLNATSDSRPPRRQPPPPSLDISQSNSRTQDLDSTPATVLTSPPERTTFSRPTQPETHRYHDGAEGNRRFIALQPPATAVPNAERSDPFSLRPVRDVDRLPSMLPGLQTGILSNPDSPTTPLPPSRDLSGQRRVRRPSIRHQTSTSADDLEDTPMEDVAAVAEEVLGQQPLDVEQTSGQSRAGSRDASPTGEAIDDVTAPALRVTIPAADEVDNVDIAQQTPTVATALNAIAGVEQDGTGTSPLPNAPTTTASPAIPLNAYANLLISNSATRPPSNAFMPRDEDVLMGLQLLAYISKYCYLRHYFQQTHLVPRLRVDHEVQRLYGVQAGEPVLEPLEEDDYEEFLQPDDYNVFPLVEKFTVRTHSKDMRYWACVVMRNLCRKDDARGGIRQCANYQCGKWEEYPRQFAKCRRCRRTKYCSKVRLVQSDKKHIANVKTRNVSANRGACIVIGVKHPHEVIIWLDSTSSLFTTAKWRLNPRAFKCAMLGNIWQAWSYIRSTPVTNDTKGKGRPY
jgi:hypothetical protein